MGLWSKIKNAAKKVWRAAKAVVRVVVRAVVTIVNSFTVGLFDLLFGFFGWPRKRLRLHAFILSTEPQPGPVFSPSTQVVPTQDVLDAIERVKKLYKSKFNVEVRPYSSSFVEVITEPAPDEALDYECGVGSEFGVAGDYFASHLAGWNAIPITFTFPVTVFVVRSLKMGSLGCSMNVIGEYVVIDHLGLQDNVALAHEIGHTCGLSPGPGWHDWTSSNLMYKESPAGENVKWFQKNILRSSRHAQYW
jgi:hypothetical protein